MPVADIQVTINGRSRHVDRGVSLAALLAELDLDPAAVVVELNRAIVRRPDLATHKLQSGDAVELVHFVGGG